MSITLESKVKEVLADPEALAIFEEIVPGISKHPGLKFVSNMSLRQCLNLPQISLPNEKKRQIEERINVLSQPPV